MEIAHFASECAPFAKVGGLADVVLGLSKELVKQGHKVDIFVPHYPFASLHLPPITVMNESCSFAFGHETVEVGLAKAIYEGINIYLLDLKSSSNFFHRDRVYGYEDDARRFLAFTKAAVEMICFMKRKYTCVHIHDWPVAIAPLIFDEVPREIARPKFLLTIHNLSYQGITTYEPLKEAGIFSAKSCKMLEDLYIPYRFNLLLGGLRAADYLNTVSPTYAEEIKTIELGRGLHEIFQKRSDKFCGILNGIDPIEIERYMEIPQAVRAKDLSAVLQFKQTMRKQMITDLDLDPQAKPWTISVTRLAEQKAPHLIHEAAKWALNQGGVFVLVGSDGDHHIRKMFEDLEKEWAHTKRIKVILSYNPQIAEKLFAAADFCVIPSFFEPCGLTQLLSFYFGTIPIVHRTGGLQDTVFDEHDTDKIDLVNGYTFKNPDIPGLQWALSRAFDEFNTPKIALRQKNCVHVDISWKNPTKRYIELYQNMF
jgi:starch synthase